jgi:hypothetical protein
MQKMKLTAKLLKKIIQEQVDELDTKEKKRERYKIYTAKVKAGKKLSPAENEDYLKIASVLDPVDYNKFQDKLDPFDYSMVQEEDRDGDMPKRLSPKEKFGEFQNFVELNGISMEQLEAMALLQQKFMKLQQFMKKYSVDAEEVSNMTDMMKDEDPLNESPSMEHITPENIELVIRVLRNLGLLITPMAGAALGISRMLDKTKKPEVSEK